MILLLEHERFDLFPDRDNVLRIEIVTDGELPRGNHPFGLESDVEEHLVPIDLHDFAGDDVAVLEGDDCLVDCFLEGKIAKIVLDDLARDIHPVGIERAVTLVVCGGISGQGARSVGHWR